MKIMNEFFLISFPFPRFLQVWQTHTEALSKGGDIKPQQFKRGLASLSTACHSNKTPLRWRDFTDLLVNTSVAGSLGLFSDKAIVCLHRQQKVVEINLSLSIYNCI